MTRKNLSKTENGNYMIVFKMNGINYCEKITKKLYQYLFKKLKK